MSSSLWVSDDDRFIVCCVVLEEYLILDSDRGRLGSVSTIVVIDVVMDGITSMSTVCIAPRCTVPLMIGPIETIRYDTHDVKYVKVGLVAY